MLRFEVMRMSSKCPKCNQSMQELQSGYVLVPARDVPAVGTKTEIMIRPRDALRVRALRCTNPACGYIEFYTA